MFLLGRNGCLNLENHDLDGTFFSIEGACLDTVLQEIGTVSFNLHFFYAQIFIRFLASLVAIESTPITSKKRLIS
jgi:hypothetical protein